MNGEAGRAPLPPAGGRDCAGETAGRARSGKGSLRERFQKMVDRAAEAGLEQPSRLWRMTPREIEWELDAFAARERRRVARMDELAWLAGRYAAVAWHAPRRYPRRPDAVAHPRAPMTDAEMKRALLRFARRAARPEFPKGGAADRMEGE